MRAATGRPFSWFSIDVDREFYNSILYDGQFRLITGLDMTSASAEKLHAPARMDTAAVNAAVFLSERVILVSFRFFFRVFHAVGFGVVDAVGDEFEGFIVEYDWIYKLIIGSVERFVPIWKVRFVKRNIK